MTPAPPTESPLKLNFRAAAQDVTEASHSCYALPIFPKYGIKGHMGMVAEVARLLGNLQKPEQHPSQHMV